MRTFLLCLILLSGANSFAQTAKKNSLPKQQNTTYDAKLAERLGADQFGMRKYVMAFLKTGPNRSSDSTTRANLQKAHLLNIEKMANEGKLVVAGPFLDDQPVRGIYIFNVSTIEEAQALTETDPAIKAGSLVMELHPFYCSAALVDVPNIHKKLQKKRVSE